MGILPPSSVYLSGFLRKSTISCTSCFRAFLSGHVLEGHLHSLIFIVFFGFAFAHAEQAAAGAAHAAEHEEPETDEQKERQERTQDVEEKSWLSS